jgi:acetyl-CoA carboxylase carboxyltransferase component
MKYGTQKKGILLIWNRVNALADNGSFRDYHADMSVLLVDLQG